MGQFWRIWATSSRTWVDNVKTSKGNPEKWVAVVRPGRILFELSYSDTQIAREAIERAIQKLPIKARFVQREEGF